MINYQSHILPNGLRIVHKPADGNVSYCGFIIDAGTRDEDAGEFGMAHFIEHMLFKGTAKRRSHHIINRMEAVGGELNAYTNKEETVIYSVFLKEHFERALELMSDLVFNSQFPQQEIEKEVDVIIDEIHSYEDNPSELIFDEFENIVYAGAQIGHNILGEPDLLQTFDTAKAQAFVAKHYHLSNMVFFSVGNTDFRKVVRFAEKYLSGITANGNNVDRLKSLVAVPSRKMINKDTSQVHALIGSCSYDLFNPKRKVLYLLNNILGGPGMNSRLNVSLREKYGYVYNVESSVTSYTDTGLFSIYFGCDKRNAEKCENLVLRELKRMRNVAVTSSQLASAKKQLMGQVGISGDNKENVALALGKSFMHYGRFDSQQETYAKIEAITSNQLLEVANEIFDENRLFTLIYN